MKKYNKIEQGSSEWHQIRKGKITGTTLKSIMGTPKAKEDAMYELIAETLEVGVQEEYENAMDRGVRLEPEARVMFEFKTNKKVDETGFCESEDESKIANSPDGLIGEDEAIEIKCLGGKNYVKMWLENSIPKEYKWQVVQYFIVNKKLKKLYFVGYRPEIKSYPMHIIEVTREELQEDIEKAEKAQKVFLVELNTKLKELIKI